jgi:hypothetical protein
MLQKSLKQAVGLDCATGGLIAFVRRVAAVRAVKGAQRVRCCALKDVAQDVGMLDLTLGFHQTSAYKMIRWAMLVTNSPFFGLYKGRRNKKQIGCG